MEIGAHFAHAPNPSPVGCAGGGCACWVGGADFIFSSLISRIAMVPTDPSSMAQALVVTAANIP